MLSIGNGYTGLNVGVVDVVVRRLERIALQVLTCQIERINHLARSQVNCQVRVTVSSLSAGCESALNDVRGVRSTGECHRHATFQCFGSCEEVHSPENKPFQLSLRLMNMLTNIG